MLYSPLVALAWLISARAMPVTNDPYQALDSREIARFSELTSGMFIDPIIADEYNMGNITGDLRVLQVYGDSVKHIYASEQLTQRRLPLRKKRIRYRVKSRNHLPPRSCSDSGRETARIFCPKSYGLQWWDCITPDEICDGVPHCGLGDDEDPTLCMYFHAAIARVNKLFTLKFLRDQQGSDDADDPNKMQMHVKAQNYNPVDE